MNLGENIAEREIVVIFNESSNNTKEILDKIRHIESVEEANFAYDAKANIDPSFFPQSTDVCTVLVEKIVHVEDVAMKIKSIEGVKDVSFIA